MQFAISLDKALPEVFYRHKPFPGCDAVIPRIGPSVTFFGTALVRQFEQRGVFCANSALGISNSRDKLRALQALSRFDIGIPPTEFVRHKADVLPAIERVGGAPVIIKLLEGTQGVGVILAETTKVAQAIIETLHSTQQSVLVQKFVSESRGRDIRALVVGDRVIAAMRRIARGDEFRSNVHRGGRVEAVDLAPDHESVAVRAAQILGLKIAGVDMLESADGPQIMEVNSSPGLEGIETATKKDIAGEIIDFVADNVQYPELDVLQLLTVSRGHSVVELHVGELLAGKSIDESGLRERELVVLSVSRDDAHNVNPSGARVLQVGDRLFCFAKVAAIKDLLPQPLRQTRQRKLRPKPAAA